MTDTIDFITELFCKVDDNIKGSKHSQSNSYRSEVVTTALLPSKVVGKEGSGYGLKKT